MTKARTKAGRKRANRDRERPEKPLAPQRAAARAELEKALEVRARAAGVWPADVVRVPGETDASVAARQEARRATIKAVTDWLKAPWHGCNAGRAIAGEPDATGLWDAMQTIRASRIAFLAAIDAPRDTSAMALMVAPDESQDGAEVRSLDLRTDEERAEAARAAWDRIEATLNVIGPQVLGSILSVVVRDAPVASSEPPTVPAAVTDWLKTAPQAALVMLRDMVVSAIVDRSREGRPVTFPLASVLRQFQLLREFEQHNRRLPVDLKEAKEWLRTRQTGEAA